MAAVMMGLVFGAGSLVFKEVTEGLGCLLGGFCSSMWILALRPGGTVHATGGKVILIAALTAGAYALSFSHYTRPYGLIGATSFAGATTAVLGFDCFSKAGLKEFWIYIWNLNDNLFPLNTNTYPITRGIKVELAVIVLICFLGVVSQLRLWKVMKDRREGKDAIRREDEREREQIEEVAGRRLEEGNQRERAQWEAVYGDQDNTKENSPTDSGIGTKENNSLRKGSISVRELEGGNSPTEITEMNETAATKSEPANNGPEKAATTFSAVTEDVTESSPGVVHGTPSDPQYVLACAQHSVNILRDSNTVPMTMAEKAPEASHAPFPRIVPLPFTIPSAEEPKRSMGESMYSFAGSDQDFNIDSKTPSGPTHNQGLSGSKVDVTSGCQSDEPTSIRHSVHSKGSSLAATVDDGLGKLNLGDDDQEGPILPVARNSPEARLLPKILNPPGFESFHAEEGVKASQSAKGSRAHPPLSATDGSKPEELQRSVQVGSKQKPAETSSSSKYRNDGIEATVQSSRSRPSAPESQTEGSQAQNFTAQPNKRMSLGSVSSTRSLTKGALDRVPSQLSHVVMSYRTNEWAKHISTANEPEFDEPEVLPEGAEEELPTHMAERPTPVNVEKFQQPATVAASSPSVSQQPATAFSSPPPADLNRTFSGDFNASNPGLPSGRASWDSTTQPDIRQVLNSQPKQGSLPTANLSKPATPAARPPLLATRGLRSSSTHAPGHALMTSPINENAETEFPPSARRSISPLPAASSTLLTKRDSFLRNKHNQHTARNTASPTEMMYSQLPSRSTSRLSLIEEAGSRSASRLGNFDDKEPVLPLRSASRLNNFDDREPSLSLRSASRLILPNVNDEDMPLSQRKAIIQQQAVTLLPEIRLAAADNFDPHLPQRSSSAVNAQKRESMLATWRQSMRQEVALSSVPKDAAKTRRAEMLVEKEQSRMSHKYSEVNKIYQENAFDQAMRRGDMQELHKEAMRKMQANANKHVS